VVQMAPKKWTGLSRSLPLNVGLQPTRESLGTLSQRPDALFELSRVSAHAA
jgi:hypothetical protein